MKALLYYGNKDIRLEEIDRPIPKINEALIKVTSTSICQTDIEEWQHGPLWVQTGTPNALSGKKAPIVLGHEISGLVDVINDSIHENLVGKRVIINNILTCEKCYWCESGHHAVCPSMAVAGLSADGGLQEYMTWPINNIICVPDNINSDEISLLEPTTVAIHAVRKSNIKPGDTAAVVGCGTVGLLVVQTLNTMGVNVIAIDLSEPMDRIVDKDEDLDFLDDYKLMNPYILNLAREKIARGGDEVLNQFEVGFKDARDGQDMDTKLKEKPTTITEQELDESYKKYRSVMGTAGRNMALAREPLGEIFFTGMAKSAEAVGCGNEIEDTIRDKFVKIPSWPLYYSLTQNDVKLGFDLTMKKSESYLIDARKALEQLPNNFSHREFLEFLFLTVEHYSEFWFKKLQKENIWSELTSNLPK